MYPNNALLGGGVKVRVRVWIREQEKDQKKIKGTIKPLMANLDITHNWRVLLGGLQENKFLETILIYH